MESNPDTLEVLRTLPLIPLRDLVVFPATLVPFPLGRPSSILALEKSAETDRMIVLAAQMDPTLDNPTPKDIYCLGVTAKVIRTAPVDDKTVKVIVEGKKRARILEVVGTHPFYQVLVKEVRVYDDGGKEAAEELRQVLPMFEDYLKFNQSANVQAIIPALREHTPDRIADIISSHLYLPLDEKQNLLETINSLERLRRLRFLLESEIYRLQASSRKDGRAGLAGKRKSAFTPGGTAAVPGGKKDESAGELEELRKKVAAAKMPPDAAEKSRKELERLESMPPMSAEATVCRNYLDWLIALPWNKKSREKRDLAEAERILNEDHFGLEKVKERILEYLSIRQLVKDPKGVILGLVGPARRGQELAGQVHRPVDGAQIRPAVARRRSRRGRDPGPSPDLHRRLPRPHHPDDQAGRDAQPGLPPRRGGQDEHGLPGRPGLGPDGGPGPGTEQRLPRPLHRHGLRPVARSCSWSRPTPWSPYRGR